MKKLNVAYVICPVGVTGSGKTYTSNILINHLLTGKEPVASVTFASPIRDIFTLHLGLDMSKDIVWDNWKLNNRPQIFKVNNMYKQLFGNDCFARAALAKLNPETFEDNQTFVITDLRFKEEFLYLYEYLERFYENIIFTLKVTNYKSPRYIANSTNISELFAQNLLSLGFQDNDIIEINSITDINPFFNNINKP